MTQAIVTVLFLDGVPAASIPVWIYDAPIKTTDAYGTTNASGVAAVNFQSAIPTQTQFVALAQYNGQWYSDFYPHSGSATVTLPFNSTGGIVNAKITAIRVQDIARQKWYNWDNGSWDANGAPVVNPGSNNLYIAVYAQNKGTASGNVTLVMTDENHIQLAIKTDTLTVGGSIGIEWTGTMPSVMYQVGIGASP
jgi:hypothetical protein